ncbi:hypothetical protein CFC21_021870 [Triticum aestivum]|uniref:rRNA N-glycosidase n=2 Tax=Triticum aestivum TaxID=4565 RepID=A0A9R1EB39_WHEAT|nr:uncharacterized protein LOC123043767 [Triticum aestivum]KAF7006870.1 hypothetical protein CFC21_021870 [Triticum aestivum]
MSDSQVQAIEELDEFYKAVDRVLVASTVKIIDVARYDVIPNFDISETPTRRELGRLFNRRNSHFKSIASLNIQYDKLSGQNDEIPVTPVYPLDDEFHTFHTVTIRGRGVTLVVLVRDSDNYVLAVKVYLTEEESRVAPWFLFEGVKLPSRFKNVVPTNYSFGHDYKGEIKFGKNVLPKLMDFMVQLRLDPGQTATDKNNLLLGALFVLLGEAQQFRRVRNWTMRTLRCIEPKPVPKCLSLLFQSWSDISKTIFHFVLGLESMRLIAPQTKSLDLEENYFMMKALEEWENSRRVHNDMKQCGLKYRNSEGEISLGCLLGGELLLLRHDPILCTKILMRRQDFAGDVNLCKIVVSYKMPQLPEPEQQVPPQEEPQHQVPPQEEPQQEVPPQEEPQQQVPQLPEPQ